MSRDAAGSGGAALPDLRRVRAIALDTNAFPYGGLDLESLKLLAQRAAAHGSIEIWVSEVVLWEWAEHASAASVTAARSIKRVKSAGLPAQALSAMTPEDVLEELERELQAVPAVVLVPVGEVAADALRDQVLVAGPARPVTAKSDKVYKVGAADSAILRSYLQQADEDEQAFVLVSADGDAARAFKNWGIEPPTCFRDLKAAARAVFDAVPSETELQNRCLAFLATRVDEVSLGSLQGDVFAGFYNDYISEVASEEAYADAGRHVVGLSDLYLDRDEGYATGTAHVLAAVTAAGVVQSSDGDSTVALHAEHIGAHLRIPVTFSLDGGAVVAVNVDEGDVTAHMPGPDTYVDARDAFNDLVNCLTCLPGAYDLKWEDPDTESSVSLTLPTGVLALNFSGTVDDAWEVTAGFAGATQTVGCRFLNDGFADSEGFELPSHYELWTDVSVGLAGFNPAWGLNAAVLPEPQMDWRDLHQDPHR